MLINVCFENFCTRLDLLVVQIVMERLVIEMRWYSTDVVLVEITSRKWGGLIEIWNLMAERFKSSRPKNDS